MYKRILVPLDGSTRAEKILPHVEKLAHNFNAQVIFLQVIEPHYELTPIYGYSTIAGAGITAEAMTEQAESYLAGLIGEFREKNIESKSVVVEGSAAHKIIEVAEREKVHLIAMASHGRSGLSRVYYGSVAASVLHLVNRPLLLVRAEGNG